MITVNKANPSQGEITSSLTGSTGDGAGLHLEAGGTITLTNAAAAEFGTSDFSLEVVLNHTANNTNNNVIYESHSSGNNRITLKALTGGDLVATFTNSSGINADYNTGYDIDVDLNTVTHYALTFDRSGDLTVYKNGNSVATISIAASSAVDIGASNTNTGRIGYVTTYGIIGTFYRFRAFNTLADAKLLFERADVPRTLTANLLFDLDLAFANENQSRMVADRSTNNVDGEMSSSGVKQTQVIKQLNSTAMRVGGTSATAATPADGEIIATGVKAETYRSARSDGDVYIQAATASDFVAIGTQASSTLLKVDGSGNVTVDGGDLKIKSPTGSMQDAELLFNSTNASAVYGATYAIDSKILSTANQSDNAYGSKLKFYTSDNSDTVTERMSIDSSGNLFLGKTANNTSKTNKLVFQQYNSDAETEGYAALFNYSLSGGNNNLYIGGGSNSHNAATKLEFYTAANETTRSGTARLTINSDGAVDISGAASGSAALTVGNSTGGTDLEITPTENASITLNASEGATARDLILATGGTPRLTVDSTGYTFFNCSSVPNATVEGFAIYGSSSANVSSSGSSTSSYNHLVIFNGNGQVGSIVSSGSATAYNTSSDYRLKENLEPLTDALDRLDALPVYRFNFKADPDTTVDGFVAHEVQAHVPEAVTGEKDAMKTVVVQEAVEAQPATYYEEGDELPEGKEVGDEKTPAVEAVAEMTEEQPDYQGIDQSKLVPLLVAAVKELKAKVETLENA